MRFEKKNQFLSYYLDPETYSELFFTLFHPVFFLKFQIFGGLMLTLQHNKFLSNTFSRYLETAGRAGYVMLVWELYFIAKTTDNNSKKTSYFLNYSKEYFYRNVPSKTSAVI